MESFSTTRPMLHILPGNAQHQGCRDQQQDGFGFSDPTRSRNMLAIVADGMGGHLLGQESSYLVVNTFLNGWKAQSPEEAAPDMLQRLLHAANREVRKYADEHGQLNTAGTTVAAAVIDHDQLHWIAVGDSRIYLYRDGEMTLLTHDHIYANRLQQAVDSGDLSPSEAIQNPHRDALTSFVGAATLAEIDYNLRPYPMQTGDRLLLCSDGFYRGLSEAEIRKELALRNPQAAADALVTRVINQRHPQQDNVTVVILACEKHHFPLIQILRQGYLCTPFWLRVLILVSVVTTSGWYANPFLSSWASRASSFVEKVFMPSSPGALPKNSNPSISEIQSHDRPNPPTSPEPKSAESQGTGYSHPNRNRSEGK